MGSIPLKPTIIWEQAAAHETQDHSFLFRIWLFLNRNDKVPIEVYRVAV
jgi:hypothetical protein